ncbi:hypothetical protein GDO86_000210 [Hymenochirus boettgeri]|uniref:Uncharacterized protein n=1 Tax=Hymenochirus boettgeri TaxID=247094 RepID=A0A8T2KAR7_9PIPI|nr:hypothetical protein GDO86_000210 [Hymenochirus boettgeri]
MICNIQVYRNTHQFSLCGNNICCCGQFLCFPALMIVEFLTKEFVHVVFEGYYLESNISLTVFFWVTSHCVFSLFIRSLNT